MFKKLSLLFLLAFFIISINSCDNISKDAADSNSGGEEQADNNDEKSNTIKPNALPTLDKSLEMVSTFDEFDHIVEYSRRKKDFAKQGLYRLSSKQGKLLEIATYENDTLHGNRILFYAETGDTQIIESYNRGKFEGEYRVFYPNGNLEQLGVYTANIMEGTWTRFYETGEPMEEVVFVDNNENGPFKEYYQNGHLKAEGYYKDGDNEHGALKMYDEEGELIKTMNCVKGICKTIWKKENK